MRFAIMQQELGTPDVERLRRALCGQAGLAAADAPKIAANAAGILLKGLVFDAAFSLQQALHAEGIETMLVAEADLPVVATPRSVKALTCTAEGLLLRDGLNQNLRVPWERVKLVAAGLVKMSDFTRVRKVIGSEKEDDNAVREAIIGGALMAAGMMVGHVHIPAKRKSAVIEYSSKEELTQQPIVSIFTDDKIGHYLLEGEHVHQVLRASPERSDNFTQDFTGLILELRHFAPHAFVNRGVTAVEQGGACPSYPNKGAFQHELIWMLWHEKEFGKSSA